MEILMVLLILALSDKNPQLKESLQSVLKFYRENRELIMAFAGTPAQPTETETASVKAAPDSEKLRVLEEFLKRQ